MRTDAKILILSVVTAITILITTGASARGWWNSDNDYWDGWGYPGYDWAGYPGNGWGGYPGYGWGGYPGYGWGRPPSRIVIYTEPRQSESSQGTASREHRVE
jgi:hypothetical protein